jgi:hypothetical protein
MFYYSGELFMSRTGNVVAQQTNKQQSWAATVAKPPVKILQRPQPEAPSQLPIPPTPTSNRQQKPGAPIWHNKSQNAKSNNTPVHTPKPNQQSKQQQQQKKSSPEPSAGFTLFDLIERASKTGSTSKYCLSIDQHAKANHSTIHVQKNHEMA